MAIYHFNVSMVSRSKGHNVIAKASYINATKMENKETGQISDYSHKSDVIYTEISLPNHAPQKFRNSQTLWNSVLEVEKAKNSQLARRGDFALPLELSKEERIELAREYIENTFVKSGMCVEWSYHDKPGNPHIDFIATTRPLKENGEWGQKEKKTYALDEKGDKIPIIDPKTGQQKIGARGRKMWKREYVEMNDWNKRETLERWREEWANHCNKYLERHEHYEKLDHRSYERQGVEKIPTIHEGYIARKMEHQGNISERCEHNRGVANSNRELSQLEIERKNNDLIIQIQLGYQKYQVIECIERADNIINDPIKSNNAKDMELAKKYIDLAQKNLEQIYPEFVNKLPMAIQDKFVDDMKSIDLLLTIHEKIYDENFNLKEIEQKQENQSKSVISGGPADDKQFIREETPKETLLQQENRFDVNEHARKMEEKLYEYMNARYMYSFATEYNIHELMNGVSHEYRDKLEKLDEYKVKYDDLISQIKRKSDELDKLGTFDFKNKKALKSEISSLERHRRNCVEDMAELSRPHYSGLSVEYMIVNQFTNKTGYDTTIRTFEYEAKQEIEKEFAKDQLPQLEISNIKKEEFFALAREVPDMYREGFIELMSEYAMNFKKQVPEEFRKNGYHAWSNAHKYVIDQMPLSRHQQKEKEHQKSQSRSFGRDR